MIEANLIDQIEEKPRGSGNTTNKGKKAKKAGSGMAAASFKKKL